MKYLRTERLSLRDHPTLNEQWLQRRILEDPSLLGLTDANIWTLASERQTPAGGRLDLLLKDDYGVCYEVELQLGPVDPDHIVRTLEYWDLERRRFPRDEHVAVIAAEEITSRYYNVINLFNGHIPIVALQVSAIDLGDEGVTLHFTTVLDCRQVPQADDATDDLTIDRDYWLTHSSPDAMALVDELVGIIQDIDSNVAANYNKHYVGLATGTTPTNYVTFEPGRSSVRVSVRVTEPHVDRERLATVGLFPLSYSHKEGRFKIRVQNSPHDDAREELAALCRVARDQYGPQSDTAGDGTGD